ncbi:hypothetical protein PC121_g18549 [Phytophthora cactorum]|nr:hypothetical protein PC120_g22713 [Phytophthora cactorum]KAG3050143.1 hypothetical protein PC121_g18549 [Phytophthora cactorum]KAG4055414.1 hypothetical protein PC123_g9505 [Phytophthora cactorum]
MARELADLRQRVSTPNPTKNKTDIVKLDVSAYGGEDDGRFHLNRRFCEVDIAVEARQLSTDLARTRFLLSKLMGEGKEVGARQTRWRRLLLPDHGDDEACPAGRQDRMSMLEYIQKVRHLKSCITTRPMDMTTQVHVFVSGMNAGYQRFYLTRKTSDTLEEAFATALREDYGVTAFQAFDISRSPAPEPEPVLMEIDVIQHYDGYRGATCTTR